MIPNNAVEATGFGVRCAGLLNGELRRSNREKGLQMNIAQHIDVAIPIIAGIFILSFPQALTKKDLALPENQKTKKTLKIAGVMVLIAGIIVLLAQLVN